MTDGPISSPEDGDSDDSPSHQFDDLEALFASSQSEERVADGRPYALGDLREAAHAALEGTTSPGVMIRSVGHLARVAALRHDSHAAKEWLMYARKIYGDQDPSQRGGPFGLQKDLAGAYFEAALGGHFGATDDLRAFLTPEADPSAASLRAVMDLCAEAGAAPGSWINQLLQQSAGDDPARMVINPERRAVAWAHYLDRAKSERRTPGNDPAALLTDPGLAAVRADIVAERVDAQATMLFAEAVYGYEPATEGKWQAVSMYLRASEQVENDGTHGQRLSLPGRRMGFGLKVMQDRGLPVDVRRQAANALAMERHIASPTMRYTGTFLSYSLGMQILDGAKFDDIRRQIESDDPELEYADNRSDVVDDIRQQTAKIYGSIGDLESARRIIAPISGTGRWTRALEDFARAGGDCESVLALDPRMPRLDDLPPAERNDYAQRAVRAKATASVYGVEAAFGNYEQAPAALVEVAQQVSRTHGDDQGTAHYVVRTVEALANKRPEVGCDAAAQLVQVWNSFDGGMRPFQQFMLRIRLDHNADGAEQAYLDFMDVHRQTPADSFSNYSVGLLAVVEAEARR
ncbi:MAG TPA: hypothetical protein VHQ86_02110 [Candidatus Saccharimonadia bacterium]|jgi:hypothetical protein|nr:hypothetical protein [Candidatus Saccharimonadia bacterium]